ncbi:MAG: hypothetical protein ACLFQK_11715 [Fibrobacterota bacterium]
MDYKNDNNYNSPDEMVEVYDTDSVVDITGKYRCFSCGSERIILKGTVSGSCENNECASPDEGWEPVIKLF